MANWMQNVVNNIQTSQNKASDFLNGIMTNEKTEYIDNKTAIVPGVYAGNHVYRKETLKHIWGVYNMLPDALTQSMGKLFEIATESMLPPKNMKNLLDYTHDGSSVYSTNIKEKYINLKDKKVENLTSVSKSSYIPWYFTDDDNLVGTNYAEYWNIGTPSNVFEHRRTAKEIERDARKAEKKAKKDARKQVREERREERQEKRINRIEKNNSERAERVEKRINKRKESKNKPNEPTNDLNFYDGSYKDKYYEDFLYETVETGNINEEGDFEVEETPVDFVLRSRLLRKATELFDRNKIHYDEQIYGSSLEKTGDYVDSLGGGIDRGRGKSLKDRNSKFFRSWSHAKRYSLLGNSMRNGSVKGEIDTAIKDKVKTQPNRDSLISNTVLQSNGLVKISPTSKDNTNGLYANLKKCMFSIENLALLDAHHVNFSKTVDEVKKNYYRDMKAKRIMWFPPYDLKFSDNSNVQWNETNFIGRGEPIYTYTNTRRSGTLSFTMLIDNPSIIHNFKNGHLDDSKLLKFFNGDVKNEDFEEKTFNVSAATYDEKEKKKGEGEPKEGIDIEGPYTCFSVYFPYCYSGQFYEKGKIDSDVMDWIYEGCGDVVHVTKDIWKHQGYEMGDGTGISKVECDESKSKINSATIKSWAKSENGYDRFNTKKRYISFSIQVSDGETYDYEIDAVYLHKFFGYKSCEIKKCEIIDNENLRVELTYKSKDKPITPEPIILTKKYILESISYYIASTCRSIPYNDTYDNNHLFKSEHFRTFTRYDHEKGVEFCTDATNEKAKQVNYSTTTTRNATPCKDIELESKDGVEKLSFKDVYELLGKEPKK